MNEGRRAKAKQITAQMLRFMYALNINQTSYIHTSTYKGISKHIDTYTHIYYLCRGVTKRNVCKSGTVADAERRTGLRMRGGTRAHTNLSHVPFKRYLFLTSRSVLTACKHLHPHTHARTYIHEFVCKYRAYLYGPLSMCCAPLPRRTLTQTGLDKGVHKKSSGVSILCTHTRAHKPGLRRTM